MDNKHFSHSHGLIYHQMPQGTEIQCSGCKCPGSGTVYVCWQCSYFLHDQCYRASRSLKHPSHPIHPLTLVPYPTYPSNSFYCNHCNVIGNGFSYSCSECEFDLHVSCAHETLSHFPTPNYSNYIHHGTHNIFNPHQPTAFDDHGTQGIHPHPSFQTPDHQNNPSGTLNFSPSYAAPDVSHQPPVQIALLSNPLKRRETKHFSHPHELCLREIEDDDADKVVVCSGCEDNLSGSVFYGCTESQCNFNLHKSCFELPREIRHKSHLEHPLTLLAKPPSSYEDGKFACNACLKEGAAFVYNCSICTFDLHIECVSLPESIKRPDHKHPLNLFYSNPVIQKEEDRQQEVTNSVCDVCRNPVHEMAWTYYCHECDFGTHLECAAFEVQQPAVKTEEELIRETEMKLALLKLLLNGGRERDAAAGEIVKEITLQSALKKS